MSSSPQPVEPTPAAEAEATTSAPDQQPAPPADHAAAPWPIEAQPSADAPTVESQPSAEVETAEAPAPEPQATADAGAAEPQPAADVETVEPPAAEVETVADVETAEAPSAEAQPAADAPTPEPQSSPDAQAAEAQPAEAPLAAPEGETPAAELPPAETPQAETPAAPTPEDGREGDVAPAEATDAEGIQAAPEGETPAAELLAPSSEAPPTDDAAATPSAEAVPTAPPAAADQEPAAEGGTPAAVDLAAQTSAETPAVTAPHEDAGAEAEATGDTAAETAAPAEGDEEGGKRRKKRKGKGGDAAAAAEAAQQPATEPAKKRKGPEPTEVVARIGTTNERALAYLSEPDPKLSRLSRKVTEALLPDLPPVTAAALLGPAGFTRHLVASAAAGRYRDLFVLWETFRRFPADAKPELAERGPALAKGQEKLKTAVRIGLTGRAERLAEDVHRAEGLIWQWLREALLAVLPAVGARPAVASALLRREPSLDVPLPAHPDERWLAEAATARRAGPLAERVEAVLAANVHRLPATVDTLRLATLHYPERVAALVDRVNLDAPDIGAFLAWARDHGAADRLHGRIRERVAGASARDRAEGLALWYSWKQRGVTLELPETLRTDSLEGFDLARPETAELAARLVERGVQLDLQGKLEELAAQNRQLAEKAYEAMVCASLDVTLPAALEENPVVNAGTRCPKCRAWTWVRPGHEARCPRPEPPEPTPVLDPFELAAAEAGGSGDQG